MRMKTFVVGPFGCNCTVLADEASREAVVIDPGGDIDRVLPFIREHDLRVRMAIHTHAHLDHIGGTRPLKDATGSRILLHREDHWLYENLPMQAQLFGWDEPPPLPVDDWLEHGQTFACASIAIEVIHTPGHSPGSVCFLLAAEGLLFSGDTLFAGSIGRTDLWGGSHSRIMESITERLLPLADAIRVIPGHGPATCIGTERMTNPFILEHRQRGPS
jgi:glyoxylase-like metal-dependent hydrolase (beta-lactamase superfamily II)